MKPMSAAPRRTGSAVLGILGILVVAGLMLTVGVVPAIALSNDAKSGPFALSSDLKIAKLQQKTQIYAKKNGKNVLLASFYMQNRDVITWDQVPASVQNATLGAEDPRFYDHGGVDPMGIVSALVNNVVHGTNRGASTISQQYVKNVCIQEAELLPTQAQGRRRLRRVHRRHPAQAEGGARARSPSRRRTRSRTSCSAT